MTAPISTQSAVQAQRQAYYQRIAGPSMTPLWEVLHALVPAQPNSPCQPALWRYAEVRPFCWNRGN